MPVAREITTERLVLRAPRGADVEAIFARYASDPATTKYLGWRRHESFEDTRAFLEFALAEWENDNPMVYLAFSRGDGRLLGSTGVTFEGDGSAFTGYVLAQDAWGQGFATEMARAMVRLAFTRPSLWRLWAMCHVEHHASERVLAKAGFSREGTLRRYAIFPNIGTAEPQDVAMWAQVRS
jgi:RimJ/RimL family protein N-acetyltransferase